MLTTPKKSFKEDFALFVESPTREGLRELLKNNIGETRLLDFKEAWPDLSDVARHVLGIGNSGGGCIVVGVKDEGDGTLNPIGLSSLLDKADVGKGIAKYIPHDLEASIETVNFIYEDAEYGKIVGKKFQLLVVAPDATKIPFVSRAEGKKIKSNQIYIRRDAATEVANYDELQRLLNARIESNYSTSKEIDLKQHLAQLQILYGEIPRFLSGTSPLNNMFRQSDLVRALSLLAPSEPNPKFPKEEYQAFVCRLIDAKKKCIERELGL